MHDGKKGDPSNVKLPIESYNVRFIIMEESFHSSLDDNTGGHWSTVMGRDVDFMIAYHVPDDYSAH